jgi:hypothetical protein
MPMASLGSMDHDVTLRHLAVPTAPNWIARQLAIGPNITTVVNICHAIRLDRGACSFILMRSQPKSLQGWLSNRIFKSFDDIVDHWCYACNTLIDQPWGIMSRRD